jgi:pimeloyl-ACP methyl ester carboxylesterase
MDSIQFMDGSGLILIPGLVCDATVWSHAVRNLPARLRAVVAEHDLSDSIVAMAQRFLAIAPPRFLLAGHSMGGRVALEMYRLARDRVSGLALLDAGYERLAAGPAGDAEVRKRQEFLDLARGKGMRAMAEVWVEGMVHPQRLQDRDLIGRIVGMIGAKPVAMFEAQIRALLERPDAADLLPQIHCPTLVLCGREDAWSPISRHERMTALIPGSRFVGVPDCGHMSTMEQPEAVTSALAEWIDSCGIPAH